MNPRADIPITHMSLGKVIDETTLPVLVVKAHFHIDTVTSKLMTKSDAPSTLLLRVWLEMEEDGSGPMVEIPYAEADYEALQNRYLDLAAVARAICDIQVLWHAKGLMIDMIKLFPDDTWRQVYESTW